MVRYFKKRMNSGFVSQLSPSDSMLFSAPPLLMSCPMFAYQPFIFAIPLFMFAIPASNLLSFPIGLHLHFLVTSRVLRIVLPLLGLGLILSLHSLISIILAGRLRAFKVILDFVEALLGCTFRNADDIGDSLIVDLKKKRVRVSEILILDALLTWVVVFRGERGTVVFESV